MPFLQQQLLLLSAMALGAAPALALSPQETYRFDTVDGASSDFFAFDLAVDAPFAIAGAHNHDTGLAQGAAYVLDWATGAQLFKLEPSVTSIGIAFGWDVAVAGTKAVVGAPFDDRAATNSGSAFVFDLSTGAETAVLKATDGLASSKFGNAVDADGHFALIGAPGNDGRRGAAYLFDLTTGAQLAKLVPSNAVPSGTDGYGFRVAISGNYGIVTDLGSVAVFDLTTFAELYLLQRPGAFGRSLDAKDGMLVVGSMGDSQSALFAGAAYVYDLATGTELAKLLAYDAAQGDELGAGVAISDSHITVGTLSADVSGNLSGSAYAYDRTTFKQVARLIPSDGQANMRFGRTVAMDGTSIFAAAVGANGFRGAAYRFDVDALDPGSPSCFGRNCPCGTGDLEAGCPNATGSGALLQGSGSTSLGADDLVLSTSNLPANQFGVYFMGSRHIIASLLGNGLLCTAGSLFRYSVQNTGPGGAADLGPGLAATTCASFPAAGCMTVGASWTFQFWYRDGGSSCPATSNSSSAWTVLFTP